ncbi:MAG: leucine-rich repeat domain-containing protein [Bacteroidaceae bacterium]|nr:leucine-rich repeat domain-containing protein [Bacteroidaceae bacterium]
MATLVVLLSLSAHAHDVEVNGIYYNINSTDKTATVTYKGTSCYNKDYSGSVVIPASFVNGGITYAVTSIGDNAFQGCSGLTAVDIPNSVTDIGSSAFQKCSGLTAVSIPSSVTYIGDYSFYGCSGLTTVNIPNSVTSIGNSAFIYCI